MDFHNFYQYTLSEDDVDCINFLLYDYLSDNILKWGISSRRIQDYVYMLLCIGLTENETLNVLIESLYHIPRRDILYESSIQNELDETGKYGKLIDCRRLLMFKIFNELEEKDFHNCLEVLFKKLKLTEPSVPLLQKLNVIILLTDHQEEVIKYFSKYGNRKIENLTIDFQNHLNSNQEQSEQLWLKVCRGKKPADNDMILALEKGSETTNPTFAFNQSGHVEFLHYNPKESYPYPEMDSSKSLCLIFNNYNYTNYPRKGSEKDTKHLRETFSKLHFTVQLYENMTKDEMFQTARHYATGDKEKSGSILVCCILAHGTRDCIFDINDEKVYIREFSLLFSAKNCVSYKDKPKLFIVQACQGDLYHEGIPESALPAESSQVSFLPTDFQTSNDKMIRDYKMSDMVPEEADFIFGMATQRDYVAFRSTKSGSWYISELCKMIEELSDRADVVNILTSVNGNVSRKNYKNSCQMPSVTFTTRKKCYLTKPLKLNA